LKEELATRLEEAKKQARETVAVLEDELVGMEDFQQLEQTRQDELLQSFSTFEQDLPHQKIIAVIRESVRTFKENDFLRLLAQKDRWIEEQKRQNDDGFSKTDTPDKQGKEKTETREPKLEYISKSRIPVSFSKSILKSESDVEEYVKAVKEAYLVEIKQGKRVQV